MLFSGKNKTARQYQSTEQQQPEPRQRSRVAAAANLGVELMLRKSFHDVSLSSFWAARSFALRARGFSSTSLEPGTTGRRVNNSTTSRAPHSQTGKRGGHSQCPESRLNSRLRMRSSSE